MNNKPVIFKKQIHSCCASFSSGDVFLHRQFDLKDIDFQLIEGTIKSNIPLLDGESIAEISENIFLIEVHLGPDKTFYNSKKMLDSASKEEMGALVLSYVEKGWCNSPNYLSLRTHNEQSFLERKLREYQGFVIPEWSGDLPVAAYQGALPNEIFLDSELQTYLKNGGCHGYIGHSQRTFATDRALVSIARQRGATNKQIANFLSHSRGRHFGDQLDCVEDVEKYFNEYFVW